MYAYRQVKQTLQRSEWGSLLWPQPEWSAWIGLTWETGFLPAWFTRIDFTTLIKWLTHGHRNGLNSRLTQYTGTGANGCDCWWGKLFELCLRSSAGSGVFPDFMLLPLWCFVTRSVLAGRLGDHRKGRIESESRDCLYWSQFIAVHFWFWQTLYIHFFKFHWSLYILIRQPLYSLNLMSWFYSKLELLIWVMLWTL